LSERFGTRKKEMQNADITLVKGDLRGIVKSIALSRAVMRNIRQSVRSQPAFFTHRLVRLLSPMIAGAAMAFSLVSVISSLMLYIY
jgi:P-type Cu+ transporter